MWLAGLSSLCVHSAHGMPQPVPCGHTEGPCTWLQGARARRPAPSHVTLGSLPCQHLSQALGNWPTPTAGSWPLGQSVLLRLGSQPWSSTPPPRCQGCALASRLCVRPPLRFSVGLLVQTCLWLAVPFPCGAFPPSTPFLCCVLTTGVPGRLPPAPRGGVLGRAASLGPSPGPGGGAAGTD